MDRVVIVGSGPSGAHFALSLARKGYPVTMLDVGYEKPAAVNPDDTLDALKTSLDDPAAYFLGQRFQGVLLPDDKKEYYGIPPSKEFVFRAPANFGYRATGFAPLFSFARGGLAEVWTAGCYPFNDAELADFPFGFDAIGPHYEEVARRIGIGGARDDLERFFPWQEATLPPLELDLHSQALLAAYEKRRKILNTKLGCYLGRTRVATLSQEHAGRKPCTYLGRCLWGCPSQSLYTPSATLAECRAYPNFTYVPGKRVSHFRFDAARRVTAVVGEPAAGGAQEEFPVERLVLAAGALCSTKIFLDSLYRATGETPRLGGLMDNRQILVPFVNLRLVGKPFRSESYQYHQLGLGVEMGEPREYVHGQITTLKTGLLHPILQNLPCDLRTAIYLVRNLHCALGIVNVNLHDTPRAENYVAVAPAGDGRTEMVIHYQPSAAERPHLERAVTTVKRALRQLGCIVPPGMAHVRPMGASAHYAGTLPMSRERKPMTTDAHGRSHDFENLWMADGATFPFLPAKNVTFTLMANAVRIAEEAF